MDNFANLVACMRFNNGTEAIVGTIMEHQDCQGDIDDVNDAVPWEGEYKVHKYPIEQLVTDIMLRPKQFTTDPGDPMEPYRASETTHIALIEGPEGDGDGFKFDTVDIKGPAMMLLWSATRNKFRFLHCLGCAKTYEAWLGAMQEEWDVDGRKALPRTYH